MEVSEAPATPLLCEGGELKLRYCAFSKCLFSLRCLQFFDGRGCPQLWRDALVGSLPVCAGISQLVALDAGVRPNKAQCDRRTQPCCCAQELVHELVDMRKVGRKAD